jgi:hypothetical protein
MMTFKSLIHPYDPVLSKNWPIQQQSNNKATTKQQQQSLSLLAK